MAAYDYENMRLENGQENMLTCRKAVDSGDVLYDPEERPNESDDLHIKYKGIARNQSNQIDANIDLVISDETSGEAKMILKDNEMLKGYHPNPQTDWNVQINPLNDKYVSLLHTTPENLHKFTYHFDENKQWYFDYAHTDTRMLTKDEDTTTDSKNQSVPDDIITKAKNDIINGEKSVDGSLYEYALEMGSWGVVYHYTITVRNVGTTTKKIVCSKPTVHNAFFIDCDENNIEVVDNDKDGKPEFKKLKKSIYTVNKR